MKRLVSPALVGGLFAALALVTPIGASAQSTSNINFNIAGGASFPTGDLGNVADVGYNLTVGLGMRQPMSPLGVRVEGTYNEWNASGITNAKAHAGGITLNGVYDFMTPAKGATSATLYGIGGIGWFGVPNSSGEFGWNLGGGFRFPLSGFNAYVEARFNRISGPDYSFVPLVFGLSF